MEIINYKAQYEQDLKDPRWQALAKKIRYRDNDRCKMCGCKKRKGMEMNVHHLRYYLNRKPWEYDESDLITICRDCHRKLHETIDFDRLGCGSYFYHKQHKGVGIVIRKYTDRIWFGLCWTETDTNEGENHGRLYIQDEAYKQDIRPATKPEVADFWVKVEKYYSPEAIEVLFDLHVRSLLPINNYVDWKIRDIFQKETTIYKKHQAFIKEKYDYFLLVSNDNFAEFDDKPWYGHTNWTVAVFPKAIFHVASKNDVKTKPQHDNIRNVTFENFDFTGYRAATIDELNEWLDYTYHLDSLYEKRDIKELIL